MSLKRLGWAFAVPFCWAGSHAVPWELNAASEREEPERRECVGDCRAKTWGRRHSESPCHKARHGEANTKRSLFNMLDRFLPRLPEQGENVAKVQQTARKEHRHRLVTARRPRGLRWRWLLCSPVSSLPSWLSESLPERRAYSVRVRRRPMGTQ